MCRFGQRMFECDYDLDLVGDIDQEVFGPRQSDQAEDEWQSMLNEENKEVTRDRLNAGLGQQLLDKAKYRLCMLGALMMHLGAEIKPCDVNHLRKLAPDVTYHEEGEDGFREAGKKQFIAALDYYKPGTPRDFRGPSCFNCGKINTDIGRVLGRCAECSLGAAWYCDRGCQKTHLPTHLKTCVGAKKRKPESLVKLLNI